MANNVRYIIMSDLHLGAENSILTRLRAGSTLADTRHPSPVMISLADCLRAVVAGNTAGELPTVIAAGDLAELALASPALSLPVVAQFVAALASGEPVVRDESIFIPGNHDHHLWEMSRERAAADFLRSGAPLASAPPTWHTSPMFLSRPPAYEATFLEDALCNLGHDRARIRVAYPDLALTSPDGERVVFVTHGHYMERVGTLMSAMARLFDPSAPPLDDVDLIERENWAWVDFFWGAMGRSSRFGALVEKIYDSMQDPRAVEALLGGLATSVTKRQNAVLRRVETWGIRRVLGRIVAGRLHERERDQIGEVLSQGSRAGLASYFDALRHTFARQWDGPLLPADVSIVVGHTHKPFSEWWDAPAWPADGMRVFNCGGWVVDHVVPQPVMGGAIVLVSDELDVVSLRIYQQLHDPSAWQMTVETVRPTAGGERFAEHVRSLIKPGQEPWSEFSAAVGELVAERRVAMRQILEGELKVLRE